MPDEYKPIEAAERTRNVKYAIRDIVLLAREVQNQGKELLYLNIGDPAQFNFQTPKHILDAIHQGMLSNDTGYAPSEGIPQAVDAIRRDAVRKGIDNISQICVTTGASEGIELALSALVNPEDNVLFPSPDYPLYPAVMSKLRGETRHYLLDEANEWQPDLADMEAKIDNKTKALVVINPNNPTGSMASDETLRQIVELAKKHNLLIMTDEIYDKLLFDDSITPTALASLAGDHPCITFNGIGKAFAGPGLRMGWSIITGNEDHVGDFRKAFMRMARARLCANTPMQWGIKAALEGDMTQTRNMVARIKEQTELVVTRLNALEGFRCIEPKGAFYIFPTVHCTGSDTEFVNNLLRETGVVTVPGAGFAQRAGTKHIRIVTLPSKDILAKAMDLFEDFVNKNK
ncbi:MAG: aminotransferase class I/II-fold pyridoxal phosphate-dependent enzyme [Proteobacteria bacterium]|nr:aminotransferase class I/II-fold pyridoxal phosphate-dependent enzyme [Pseudomonadota bacterium]